MRRAPEAKWAPAAAANYSNNYQKSNNNHFLETSLKCIF